MKNKYYLILVSSIFYFFPTILIAQNDILSINYLTIKDGLLERNVDCLLQDYEGYLWYASHSGLGRYDGYNFKFFKFSSSDSNSISSNVINVLYEDRQKNLWIGTEGGGLNRYNRQTQSFSHWIHSADDSNSVEDNCVRAIYEDRSGTLWIGTIGGLYTFDRVNEVFVGYNIYINGSYSFYDHNILKILEDRNGMLWIGSSAGLVSIDKKNHRLVTNFSMKDPNALLKGRVTGLLEDRYGSLWITTRYLGVYQFIPGRLPGKGELKHFQNIPGNDKSLSSNEVKDIIEDESGVLWFGTMNGGLNQFDREHGTFRHYLNARSGYWKNSNNERVRCIIEDRSGILWLGTAGNGLAKIIRKNNYFKHFQKEDHNPNSLSDNSIMAIEEDWTGKICIGTETNGLSRYDQMTGKYRHYITEFNVTDKYTRTLIRFLYKDRSGVLWIGTNKGLRKLQITRKNNGREEVDFIVYRSKSGDPSSLLNDAVLTLFEDHRGTMWVGTVAGLCYMDRGKGIFSPIQDADNLIKKSRIVLMYEDRKNVFWIGTMSGLFIYDRDKKILSKYSPSSTKHMYQLDNEFITSVCEDRVGNLWFGTKNGLYRINKNDTANPDNCIAYYAEQCGLPSAMIFGLLEDDRGNIWMSTQSGLSKLNPLNGTINNYLVKDGFSDLQFYPGSCFKSKNGEMFFGGPNGMVAFYPDSIKANSHVPTIVLTDFKIYESSVQGDSIPHNSIQAEFGREEEIILPYERNFFSFEFATLDFVQPEENKFIYKMEGFDKDWIYGGTRHFARYTNVKPGTYTFKVRGCNYGGVWNEKASQITIVILPPFWQTWWFLLLSSLASIFIIVAVYRMRTITIRKRNKELSIINETLSNQIIERRQAEDALKQAHAEVEDLKDRLQAENVYLRGEIEQNHHFEEIVGQSEAIRNVLRKVEQVALTDSTVLLLGETGTGKELLARAIHNNSTRKERPLVKVNCAAIPSELVESELFGHERGAFTNAIKQHQGKFELAHGGTIFLDEIGEIPHNTQIKILRVLQDKEIDRVGGDKPIKVDVRVIVATNRNLLQAVEDGKFRSDLFYRLNVFPIEIPPLRERTSDIPILVDFFLRQYSKSLGKTLYRVSKATLAWMLNYSWPGNIRELQNVIERAAIITTKPVVSIDSLNSQNHAESDQVDNNGWKKLEEIERDHILKALKKTNWVIGGEHGAASILGLKRTTLQFRIRKLRIHKQ